MEENLTMQNRIAIDRDAVAVAMENLYDSLLSYVRECGSVKLSSVSVEYDGSFVTANYAKVVNTGVGECIALYTDDDWFYLDDYEYRVTRTDYRVIMRMANELGNMF